MDGDVEDMAILGGEIIMVIEVVMVMDILGGEHIGHMVATPIITSIKYI